MTGAKHDGAPSLVFWEWLVAAYILGVFLVRFPVPVLAASILLGLVFAARRLPLKVWPMLAFCMAVGFIHTSLRLPEPPASMPSFVQTRQEVVLTGRVDEVLTRPGERLEIRLADAAWMLDGEQGALPGKVAWTWDLAGTRPEPGARVEIGGVRVKPARGFVNPGVWNYEFYRRLQGVFYRVYTRGVKTPVVIDPGSGGESGGLRARFRQVLDRYAPAKGPARGLIAALTMGDRYKLTPETVELFRQASLAHSLALSGMHLGFVAALGFGLAWLAGAVKPSLHLGMPRPKMAVLAAAPLAAFYIWLGGASPSLVRSGIMFASFGLMLMLGRGRVLVDGLFAALALILIVSPLSAYDIRLQFSAVAVGGILVLFPPCWRFTHRVYDAISESLSGPGPEAEPGPFKRTARFIGRGAMACLLVSLCANLALMPLVVWNFGTISLNILPNLFWLPIMGAGVLPLSLIGMVLGAVPYLAPVGGAFIAVAGWLCSWSVGVIGAAAHAGLIGETVALRPAWGLALGYYALLVSAAVFMRGGRARTGAAVLAAGLIFAALPGLARERPFPHQVLSVAALDTGQSQSLVLEFPDGSRALIDGGGVWSGNFDMGRAITAPVLTSNSRPALDFMVMTHPHLDHCRGLIFPLRHFSIGRFAHNGRLPSGEVGEEMALAIAAYGREPEVWRAGDAIRAGPETVIEVLHPPEGFEAAGENDNSLALRIVWRGMGMALLPGDLEEPGLRTLMDSGADLSARLLVLPHHGGKCGLTSELLDRVGPELALACAGNLNYLGLPHEDTISVLEAAGAPLASTGEKGMIEVSWDGPQAPTRIESALP